MRLLLRSANNIFFLLLYNNCLHQVFQVDAGVPEDNGPVQIADDIDITISSKDDDTHIIPVSEELPNGDLRKTYTVFHSGASYISVHFASFNLSPKCQLETTDGDNKQSSIFTGLGRQQLGTFWGHHVEGETMKIELLCHDNDTDYEFLIDEYAAGYPVEGRRKLLRDEHFIPRDLSICNSDDKQNAICYSTSHPDEYNKSKAVARLVIFGTYGCTGFLVGDSNMLLTANHCLTINGADAQDGAANTDVQFMLESTSCGSNSGWTNNIFDAIGLLQNDYTKDYALLQVDEDPFSIYGSLELEYRLPDDGELIYIPQHAGLRDKELAIFDTDSTDPSGRCNVDSTSTRSCGRFGATFKDVSYTCDTEGGTSGSPIISAETGKVIALHHCGGGCKGNVGVPMTQIYIEIAALVYPENVNSGSNGDPHCKYIWNILKKRGIAYA
jgi:hypothetical protein